MIPQHAAKQGDVSRAFPVGPPLRPGSAKTVPAASLTNSAEQLQENFVFFTFFFNFSVLD